MKKFQKLNEGKFQKFTKDRVSSIVGGKAKPIVDISNVFSTGPAELLDVGDISTY